MVRVSESSQSGLSPDPLPFCLPHYGPFLLSFNTLNYRYDSLSFRLGLLRRFSSQAAFFLDDLDILDKTARDPGLCLGFLLLHLSLPRNIALFITHHMHFLVSQHESRSLTCKEMRFGADPRAFTPTAWPPGLRLSCGLWTCIILHNPPPVVPNSQCSCNHQVVMNLWGTKGSSQLVNRLLLEFLI